MPGEDLDANGVQDRVEQALLDKFKPVLILHSARVVEPEPVEIMARDGHESLELPDVYVNRFRLTGSWEGVGNYCTYHSNDCLQGQAMAVIQGPALNGDRLEVYCLEYGVPGDEEPVDWFNTYMNGTATTGPGSDYPPTIYGHLFFDSGRPVLQYYFFYPYDAASNWHEGDWEHINVVITDLNPSLASIFSYQYYFHEKRLDWGLGAPLRLPYVVDSTHVVVFVGGFMGFSMPDGSRVEGNESGASYPWPGVWTGVSDVPLYGPQDETVLAGGKLLHYSDLQCVWMPGLLNGNAPFIGCYATSRGWMASNLRWGHLYTDTLYNNWLLPDYLLPSSSPAGPVFQASWESLTPSSVETYGANVTNTMESPGFNMLFINLTSASGDVFGPTVPVRNAEGDLTQRSTHQYYYKLFEELPCDQSVTVPERVGEDGEYRFWKWSDGYAEAERIVHWPGPEYTTSTITALYIREYSGQLTSSTNIQGTVSFTGLVTVAPGSTLRLLPGCAVLAQPDQETQLIVEGELQALGTAGAPCVLRSARLVPTASDWCGVSVRRTQASAIANCEVSDAVAGVVSIGNSELRDLHVRHCGGGIYVYGSSGRTGPGIVIEDCSSVGMAVFGGTTQVGGVAISEVTGAGVLLTFSYAGEVVGTGISIGNVQGDGIRVVNCQALDITGVSVDGATQNGIVVGSSAVSIQGSTSIGHCGNAGIYGNNASIQCSDVLLHSNGIGVYAGNGSSLVVRNTTFERGQYGVVLDLSSVADLGNFSEFGHNAFQYVGSYYCSNPSQQDVYMIGNCYNGSPDIVGRRVIGLGAIYCDPGECP